MKTTETNSVRKTTAQNATTGCKCCDLPATNRGYCAPHAAVIAALKARVTA